MKMPYRSPNRRGEAPFELQEPGRGADDSAAEYRLLSPEPEQDFAARLRKRLLGMHSYSESFGGRPSDWVPGQDVTVPRDNEVWDRPQACARGLIKSNK